VRDRTAAPYVEDLAAGGGAGPQPRD
jgi:hypothetical protein